MVFGLTLGGLTLSANPARAIEITNIQFLQCAPRACTIPFTLEMQITASGSAPFQGTFTWGDGAITQTIANNGSSSSFDVTHQYTVKGNYTLAVQIIDAGSATWRNSYKVSAYTAGYYGSMTVTTRIEGTGFVSALIRRAGDYEPIGATVQNTGSAFLAPFKVQFYAQDWAHLCDSESISLGLLPGQIAYIAVDTINFDINCGGFSLTPVWAKTTSTSWPSLNSTSPQMTITYLSSGYASASLSVQAVTPAITMATGAFAQVQYQVVNTGQFTIDFYDALNVNPGGSLLLYPQDLGNPYHSLTINRSAQVTSFNGIALFQSVGRIILQPGQSIYINRTIQAVVGSSASSILLGDTLSPKCLYSAVSGGDSSLACGLNNPNPVSMGVGVTITLTLQGATVIMSAVIPLGNGTVQFQGTVVNMGSGTAYMTTWFLFWKSTSPGTTYTLPSGTIFAPGTVTATASGLGSTTNYTVQFVAQGTGPAIYSNQVAFTTPAGATNPGGGGSTSSLNFIQAMIFQFASAAGMPPELLGFLIGLMVFGFAMLCMVLIVAKYDVDLPTEFWAGFFPALLIINVWLFFWPPLALVLIIVPEAILLANKFMSGGSASG